MKKITFFGLATLMLGISMTNTSCMGSWNLTKKVYKFNETVTGNKFINNILFWILGGLGVYGVTIFIDYVILNLIEFWTGSNLLSMKEGEIETQIVKGKDGFMYEMVGSKNRLQVTTLSGPQKGHVEVLQIIPEESRCTITVNGKTSPLLQYNEATNVLTAFGNNGERAVIDANALETAWASK